MNDRTQAVAMEPLVKTVTVRTDLTLTFELFTERIGQWWPLVTHSVGGDEAVTVRLGNEVGARIEEITAGGQVHVWGTVTHWDPPVAVAFTWHPGRPEAGATRVTVRFREISGGTEVELTHDGWKRRDDGQAARRAYDTGWELVLGRLVELASRQGA